MSEACKQFDVLRILEMIPDRLNQGRLVFKDTNGKIVFIDKNEVDVCTSDFEIGKKYLAWVVEDLDKQSYARFTIDGLVITYFILNKINTYTLHDLYEIAESKPMSECVMFSNNMYNHDIGFSKSQEVVESMHEKETRLINELEDMDINSELSEFVYELGILFVYVYNTYGKVILKEIL